VVFNTSMTGYQEMLTDPSYHGQILTLTTSHIGQVGVNPADTESDRIWARALVVQDLDLEPSSWRADGGAEAWLAERGVTVGWGFDTRAIVRHVRTAGAVPGLLVTDGTPPEDLSERAAGAHGTDGLDLAREVACDEAYDWDEGPWVSPSHPIASAEDHHRPTVAVIDFGVKRSILRRLVSERFRVRVLPPDTSADELMSGDYAGVVFSNGPGDPSAVAGACADPRHLHGLPAPRSRPRRPHRQAALRPPRRQPPGSRARDRARAGHFPESQLRRRGIVAAA